MITWGQYKTVNTTVMKSKINLKLARLSRCINFQTFIIMVSEDKVIKSTKPLVYKYLYGKYDTNRI